LRPSYAEICGKVSSIVRTGDAGVLECRDPDMAGRRHGGQMRFLQMPAANYAGARSRTAQAVLFLMAPTIAVRTAPATPPPATWPTMLPISGVEALLASNGISIPRS